MKRSIHQNGPISCGIAVTDELFYQYKGGIFRDHTGAKSLTHEVSIVGYGEEEGVKFWRIRNSWGEFWGEDGYLRIVRGENNLGIEKDCAWATVKDTWTEDIKHVTTDAE